MTVDWRQKGACVTGDPDRFFNVKGRPPKALVDLCHGCAALLPCTFDALRGRPGLGFQAGMSEVERIRLRRWDRQARQRLASEAQKREATS